MMKRLIVQRVIMVNIKIMPEKLVAKTAQQVDIEQLITQMIIKIGMVTLLVMEIMME